MRKFSKVNFWLRKKINFKKVCGVHGYPYSTSTAKEVKFLKEENLKIKKHNVNSKWTTGTTILIFREKQLCYLVMTQSL